MSLDLTDGKSRLVQVMAWCHQAPSHYLSQWWPRSMSPYGINEFSWGRWTVSWQCILKEQAVPINGDNIPPLWSVPTPSRNTQQIVLFLSHCGSYTGENHSRKICLRRISAWLCPLECHGMEGIEAAFDTKSLGNVKKVFAKSCGNPIFGQFLATRGPKMRARTRKSIGVQRLTP